MAEKTEAIDPVSLPAAETMSEINDGLKDPNGDSFEVFKKTDNAVDYRTVGWPHAAVILLKSKGHRDLSASPSIPRWFT